MTTRRPGISSHPSDRPPLGGGGVTPSRRVADQTNAATVAELRAILDRFPGNTPIVFTSHDGDDYGWMEIGRPAWGQPAILEVGNPRDPS